MRGLDLLFEFADLTVKLLEVIEQTLDQPPKVARQLVACMLDEFRHLSVDVRDSLRNDEAELGE